MMYGTPIATMGRYNHEGTLIVNLIDTRTKKSAWVALVKETIDRGEGTGQKKLPRRCREDVQEVSVPEKPVGTVARLIVRT